jgi:ATP adenylyltransferase
MNPSQRLYRELAGEHRGSNFRRLCPNSRHDSRVIWEDAAVVVMPSLGPLAPGHVLLFTKTESISFGAMGVDKPSKMQLVLEWKDQLVELLSQQYGRACLVFEHGPCCRGGKVGCGVDRAHLHLVPCEDHVVDSVINCGLRWESVSGLDAARRAAEDGVDYYYLEWLNDAWISRVDGPSESQYLRRVISAAHGTPEQWDWRSYPRAKIVEATLDTLLPLRGAWPSRSKMPLDPQHIL